MSRSYRKEGFIRGWQTKFWNRQVEPQWGLRGLPAGLPSRPDLGASSRENFGIDRLRPQDLVAHEGTHQ